MKFLIDKSNKIDSNGNCISKSNFRSSPLPFKHPTNILLTHVNYLVMRPPIDNTGVIDLSRCSPSNISKVNFRSWIGATLIGFDELELSHAHRVLGILVKNGNRWEMDRILFEKQLPKSHTLEEYKFILEINTEIVRFRPDGARRLLEDNYVFSIRGALQRALDRNRLNSKF